MRNGVTSSSCNARIWFTFEHFLNTVHILDLHLIQIWLGFEVLTLAVQHQLKLKTHVLISVDPELSLLPPIFLVRTLFYFILLASPVTEQWITNKCLIGRGAPTAVSQLQWSQSLKDMLETVKVHVTIKNNNAETDRHLVKRYMMDRLFSSEAQDV